MRHLAIFITLIVLAINIQAQNNLVEKTVSLIQKSYVIYESNPIHKDKSDSITNFLHTSLKYYLKHNRKEVAYNKLDKAFKMLYNNSSSFYSDSPEERRMKLRRAACFASIALITDLEKSFTYLDYAKYTLAEEIKNPNIELLEEPYLGLLFLELLLKYETGRTFKNDLINIKSFIQKNKENISEEIIQNANKIIIEYHKK